MNKHDHDWDSPISTPDLVMVSLALTLGLAIGLLIGAWFF